MTTKPLAAHVGVEVSGISGARLAARATAEDCAGLLDQFGVVVYRDANLSDDELIEFSGMLGEVAIVPTGEHERPEIQTITLDPARTNPTLASIRRGNFFWHIDGMTEVVPQKATLLSAREVADQGEGGTQFVSTYRAYETLSPADKSLIDDLEVVHSFAAAQELANADPSAEERAMWERVPSQVHPLAWSRRDGRTSLLIGATAERIVGTTLVGVEVPGGEA